MSVILFLLLLALPQQGDAATATTKAMVPTLVAPAAPSSRFADFILAKAPPRWRLDKRTAYARSLAARIEVEAKRRSLDPVALVAIAWIESNFQPWARGRGNARREGEHGTWQLIRGDNAVNEARARLEGCAAPKSLSRSLHPWWERRRAVATQPCEDQTVADARTYHLYWLASELQDVTLSTYIAAYEIRQHLDQAKATGWTPGKIPPSCQGLPAIVPFYARYNSGHYPVRYWYVHRLCERYKAVQAEVK
jgi:hypothetical protein